MKNKRNVLIAFILICCLCLSIGYAALTDTLYVNGTVNLDLDGNGPTNPDEDGEEETPWEEAFNEDVYFANSSNATVAVIGQDKDGDANDLLTITVPDDTFTPEKRTVTYTVDIKNDSKDYAAQVTLKDTTTNFSVDCKWTTENFDGKIAAESSANVTITITLTNAPDEDVSESFNITFNAVAVD